MPPAMGMVVGESSKVNYLKVLNQQFLGRPGPHHGFKPFVASALAEGIKPV